jgi:predicted lipoprotein with Yx(FWY)xxD motif
MKKLLIFVTVAAAALAVIQPTIARVDAQAGPQMKAKPTLTVRSTQFGRILFDGRGQALYAFTRDRRGAPSTCYGDCAEAWPVYFRQAPLTAGNGVKASLIGTTRRKDGRLQVTYNGRPLYSYAHEGLGEVKCQNVFGFGGLWLVARPDGTLVR